jgi:hypothetical protein
MPEWARHASVRVTDVTQAHPSTHWRLVRDGGESDQDSNGTPRSGHVRGVAHRVPAGLPRDGAASNMARLMLASLGFLAQILSGAQVPALREQSKKRGVRLLGLPPKLRPPASLPGSCFPYQGVYTEKVVLA